MSIIEYITSLYAPDECLSCHREGVLLCSRCEQSIAPPPGVCFGCYESVNGVACSKCRNQSGCSTIVATAHYAGLAKQLVASLKFKGSQSAARIMATQMAAMCPATSSDTLVTYVPATTQHARQRGYDQGALLSRHVARLLGCEAVPVLARSGKKHQLGTSRQGRLNQLTSSLRVNRKSYVHDKNILLVDDVLTTGSSVQAATAILLAAGARRVDVVVFAQAIERLRKSIDNKKDYNK